jgi:hypothetical protein
MGQYQNYKFTQKRGAICHKTLNYAFRYIWHLYQMNNSLKYYITMMVSFRQSQYYKCQAIMYEA